jgi:hypothetical protein
MRKSIIQQHAENMKIISDRIMKCPDDEIENESKRMDVLSKAGEFYVKVAREQVNLFLQTGQLPEDNLLTSDELVINKPIAAQKSKGLLMEEFTRK